jgi:hypothetical protein
MAHTSLNGDIVERPWLGSGDINRNGGGEDDGSFIPIPTSRLDACRDCDGSYDEDDGYSSDDSFVSADYPIQYPPCDEDSLTCRMGLGSYCRMRGYHMAGVKQEELEKKGEPIGQPWLQRNHEPSCSVLEKIPAEIRMLILLSIPDLRTLRSLIHASPVMHAQYRHTRRTRHLVLSTCLGLELEGYYYDAYANMKSRKTEFKDDMSQKGVRLYINSYKEWKKGPCPPLESLRPGQVRWMAAYYLSVIQPLQIRYSRWALRNLLNAHEESFNGGWDKTAFEAFIAIRDRNLNGDLSRNEKIRICRSLYRYGTYQSLFGRDRQGYYYADGTRQADRPFSRNQVRVLFKGLFSQWDMEGLAYIDIFVRDTYHDIFHFAKLALCPRRRAGEKCEGWASCGCVTYNCESLASYKGKTILFPKLTCPGFSEL